MLVAQRTPGALVGNADSWAMRPDSLAWAYESTS